MKLHHKQRLLRLLVPLSLALALIPAGRTRSENFADTAFLDLWQRTDQLVYQRTLARTWIWGPSPGVATRELYAESPDGTRLVQYFDKSRMEINDPRAPRGAWYVTNGLLVRELATGQMQVGDRSFVPRGALELAVAGDPERNEHMPTYAAFGRLDPALTKGLREGYRVGQPVTAFWDGQATPTTSAALALIYPETAFAYYDDVTGLNVPGVLWTAMNAAGDVLENGRRVRARPLYDWLFVVGRPISSAYWTRGRVGGVERDILVQLFERRVLTYTPANAAGWRVEMGNVGQHYYRWRYGTQPPGPLPSVEQWSLLYRQNGALFAWNLSTKAGRRLMPMPDTVERPTATTSGRLAFTLHNSLMLADLVAGTTQTPYIVNNRAAMQWGDLRWSTDQRALAYTLAYDDPDGIHRVEVGTIDGSTVRVVADLTAGAGAYPYPAPTPQPSYTNLQLLGYSRQSGQILVTPVGGPDQYRAIWRIETATGRVTTALAFDDPAAIRSVAVSPDLAQVAVGVGGDRVVRYSLLSSTGTPRVTAVLPWGAPGRARIGSTFWSPDSRWLVVLLYDGRVPPSDEPVDTVWVIEAATMEPRYLTGQSPRPAHAILNGWDPDGQRVLVTNPDAPASADQFYELIRISSGARTWLPLGANARIIGWMSAQ